MEEKKVWTFGDLADVFDRYGEWWDRVAYKDAHIVAAMVGWIAWAASREIHRTAGFVTGNPRVDDRCLFLEWYHKGMPSTFDEYRRKAWERFALDQMVEKADGMDSE